MPEPDRHEPPPTRAPDPSEPVAAADPADPAPPAPPLPAVDAPRLHPDHVAAMLRADGLEKKLADSRRMLGSLQGELLRTTAELERAREQARAIPRPRPVTRVGLLASGAAFGVLAATLLQVFLFGPDTGALPSRPSSNLDVPITPPAGPASPTLPVPPGRSPAWSGRVTSSSSARVPPGTPCALALEVQTSSGGPLACQGLLECGAATLYGGAQRGFFPCELRGLDAGGRPRVSGRDEQVTAGDGDPAMELDTDRRTVRVWETSAGGEPYDVTVTLDPA